MDLNISIPKVRWQASLSNGETFYEGKAPFDFKYGEKMPWNRLERYIVDKKVNITSLALIFGDRSYNLPSIGKNPNFREFALQPQPLDYNVYRKLATDRGYDDGVIGDIKKSDHFTVAEAVYGVEIKAQDGETKASLNFKLQLWVDEKNPKNSYLMLANN